MSFRVQIPQTQESFDVDTGETVLSAALRANVPLPHDCQAGGCASCRIKLVHGAVSYEEFPFGLTPEEAEEGYALACQGVPTGDLVIEVPDTSVPLPEPERHTAVVTGVDALCDGITRLTVSLADDAPVDYVAGQYMNVLMDDGYARSFSMSTAPAREVLEFHVRRVAGGRFTDGLLQTLQPGDRLEVELPLGSFVHRPADYRPLLMVATGTGIAPIRSILESLLDDPDCPPVHLYWGMRKAEDLYLDEEIRSWADRFDDFTYVPVLSKADDAWQGRRGYVQDAVTEDLEDLSEHAIYLCGSPAMIFDAKQAFLAHDADPDFIYAEGFTTQACAPGADPDAAARSECGPVNRTAAA